MSPSLVSLFDKSPCVELRVTTHGGRSLFATCDIEPVGTRIHEVQAEGLLLMLSIKTTEERTSRTWNIKWSRTGATTAWFCSDVCKHSWERDEASPLLMEVDALLTKGQAATRKRLKSPEEEVRAKSIFPVFEPSGDSTITQETINGAWERVEALVTSRAYLSLCYSTLHLEDMELEIARLLAAAIVRRYYGEHFPPSDSASQTRRNRSEAWSQFLDLQASESCNIRTRPYILAAYLRVYVFLAGTLPRYLQEYISSIREVLARDTGNSFGIWDGNQGEEMVGWGIWVSASYFNHCCTPNVVKKREGRALHFEVTRKIRAGEELYISYIDTDPLVDGRRRELEASWFFTCRCPRCEEESSV